MVKFLVTIVVLAILGASGYAGLPWIMDLVLEVRCPDDTTDVSCPARMRAAGHMWAQRDDLNQAGYWYLRASRSGDPRAMFHLAWVYEELVLDHFQEEMRVLIADESGMPLDKVGAARSPRNYKIDDKASYIKAAAAWYHRSAQTGFTPSMNNLGAMYTIGLEGEPDHGEAFRWYLKGARAGNPIAIRNVMAAYNAGRGVQRDSRKAADWSPWQPRNGITDDLKSPTLRRTRLIGVNNRTEEEHEALRYAARTGDRIYLKVRALTKQDLVPTFADVQGELLRARNSPKGTSMPPRMNLQR